MRLTRCLWIVAYALNLPSFWNPYHWLARLNGISRVCTRCFFFQARRQNISQSGRQLWQPDIWNSWNRRHIPCIVPLSTSIMLRLVLFSLRKSMMCHVLLIFRCSRTDKSKKWSKQVLCSLPMHRKRKLIFKQLRELRCTRQKLIDIL